MKVLANISRFGLGILLMLALALISSCKPENKPVEDIRRDATVIAVEKVMSSVVNVVEATRTRPVTPDMYDEQMPGFTTLPDQTQERPDSVGSGVIIDEAGFILTSLHVVQVQKASRIRVKLWDGREFDCDPIVVGIPDSDVALLKIHDTKGEKFQPIKFAQDDDLLLGETVIAIGNPLNLGGSVTKGILSSRSRRLLMKGPLNYQDWLQTDAAINEGNSGGPLINLLGDMIGLNEAVVTNQQNISFAIPVKQLQKAISQFFAPEVMNQIWFGGRVNSGHGPVHFDSVQPNSPAFLAGIRVSDEIVNVNGVAVQNTIQFHRALCGSVTNRNVDVKMVVRRNGENYNTTVHLISFDNLFLSKLGITLTHTDEGWVISTVEPDSPAAIAQLQPGYILVGIDGLPVSSLKVAEVLSTNNKGATVSLNVIARRVTAGGFQVQQGTVNVVVR